VARRSDGAGDSVVVPRPGGPAPDEFLGGSGRCLSTHVVRGGGKSVAHQNAGVDCAFVGALSSGFCNWRIDFSYADTDNKTWRTSRGRTHPEGKIDPMRNNSPRTLPRCGKACAHLYVNGVRRVSRCHHITK